MAEPRKTQPMKNLPTIYHRFDAAFRIWGPDFPIEEISAAIGIDPTEFHRNGEPRGKGKWEDTMWSFRLPADDNSGLEEQLSGLIDRISCKKSDLRVVLSRFPDCRAGFWCAHYTNAPHGFAGMVTLSPNILNRLAELGFALSIDTYCDSD